MKRSIAPVSEAEIRQQFPITDRVPGWFFRVRERSAGVYEVEGADLYGRRVSRVGTDDESLLAACVADAAQISRQVGDATSS